MPTFRELYDALATMSPEQLDTQIRIIPTGYTDEDAAAILQYPVIPQVLEIATAPRDIFHYSPAAEETKESGNEDSPEDDFPLMPAGVSDFSDSEIEELGIADDPEYRLLCRKGTTYLKIKDNIVISTEDTEHFARLNAGIMPL